MSHNPSLLHSVSFNFKQIVNSRCQWSRCFLFSLTLPPWLAQWVKRLPRHLMHWVCKANLDNIEVFIVCFKSAIMISSSVELPLNGNYYLDTFEEAKEQGVKH